MLKKFKKLTCLVILLLASCYLTGCASIFGNNNRTISVTSTPLGADILY